MKVKLNDKVLVISGKEKGKSGKIMRIQSKNNKVVVEKLNMRTKHIKKTSTRPGEKIHFEGAMAVSNVMVLCSSCSKPTRVGYKVLENGKKERVCKKCNQSLDASIAATATKAKGTKKIKAV